MWWCVVKKGTQISQLVSSYMLQVCGGPLLDLYSTSLRWYSIGGFSLTFGCRLSKCEESFLLIRPGWLRCSANVGWSVVTEKHWVVVCEDKVALDTNQSRFPVLSYSCINMGHTESWEVRWKGFQEVSGGKLGTCNDSVGRPVCRRQIRKHLK